MGSLCQTESNSQQELKPAARPEPSIIAVHIVQAGTRKKLPEDFGGAPSAPKVTRLSSDSDCREAGLVQELGRFMEIAGRKK